MNQIKTLETVYS